ncbi:uncharacterized protein METZ01_LOCUS136800, partial [marine metagenome]
LCCKLLLVDNLQHGAVFYVLVFSKRTF